MASQPTEAELNAQWDADWSAILTGSLVAATRNPSRPLDAIDEFLLGRIATANDAKDGA